MPMISLSILWTALKRTKHEQSLDHFINIQKIWCKISIQFLLSIFYKISLTFPSYFTINYPYFILKRKIISRLWGNIHLVEDEALSWNKSCEDIYLVFGIIKRCITRNLETVLFAQTHTTQQVSTSIDYFSIFKEVLWWSSFLQSCSVKVCNGDCQLDQSLSITLVVTNKNFNSEHQEKP